MVSFISEIFNRQLLHILSFMKTNILNRIGGVMVSMRASSAVDSGFEPQSGKT
jgi:hypothetical protein